MTDIRFTATTDDWDTEIFRDEDAFIAYLDRLWQPHGGYPSGSPNIPRIQARRLSDPEPRRYPCMMLIAGQTEDPWTRQDILHNIYLYDLEIHEDEEEGDELLAA